MRHHTVLGFLLFLNTLGIFLIQLLVFFEFGSSSMTDAFMASLTVPQAFTVIVSVALTSVLIPQFAGEDEASQKQDGWSVLLVLGGIFFVISLLLYLTADLWVALIFPGFSPDVSALCINLTRIQVFSMLFTVSAGVASAIYHARNQFILVAVRTCIVTFFSVLAIYILLPVYGLLSVAWVLLISSIILLFSLLPVLGRPHGFDLRKDRLQELWAKISPMLVGNIYCKSEILIDRYLLSMGTAGDMSLYALGRQLYDGVGGIVSKTLANTAIPRLSVYYKQQNVAAFERFGWRRLVLVGGLALFGYLIFLAVGESLLVYLVGYGEMKSENIHYLWWIMVLLGGTFIFGIVGSLLAGVFYSIGDTRTPTYLSMLSLTLFIIIKVYAYKQYGILGLSVATSVYFFINALLMMLVFPTKLYEKR